MTVARESVQAYHEIKDLEDREQKVKEYLEQHPGSTYVEVAKGCRMSKKDASSRLSDLTSANEVIRVGLAINPKTNRKLSKYYLKGGDTVDRIELHNQANHEFYNLRDLPYSEAIKVINLHLILSDDPENQFLWECVRCKLNEQQKERSKKR